MTGRMRTTTLVAVGLALAVALAFLVAPEASSEPDGLEKVADDEGFLAGAEEHDLAGSPTADYGVSGIDDPRLGTGLAGVLGIALSFGAAGGLLLLVRRSRREGAGPDEAPRPDGGGRGAAPHLPA